jgi:hypothetical protein
MPRSSATSAGASAYGAHARISSTRLGPVAPLDVGRDARHRDLVDGERLEAGRDHAPVVVLEDG